MAGAAILAAAAVVLLAGPALAGTVPGTGATTPIPSSGDADVTAILRDLFILLLAAKVGEEILRRLGQPGMVGELIGGYIVGPFGLGLVHPGETALVFSELGVVMLLFSVGLEVRTDDLLRVGRMAIVTAVIAMALPIAAGVVLALGIGATTEASVFVGLAMAATSIGITSRVLRDLGVMDEQFAKIVIGAALVDDILALVLIGLATGFLAGDVTAATLFVGIAGVGLVLLGFVVARRARGLPTRAFTWPLFADTPLVPAFLMMLALALIAAAVGLAAIIGAFVAGLIIAETEAAEEVERETKPPGLDLHAVLLRGHGRPARPVGPARPEARPARDRARGRGRAHQDDRRDHRRLVHRPLGRDERRLRDGAPRRGRDRGREPRAGGGRRDRRHVRAAAGRDRHHDRRGAVPAGLVGAAGEG